MQPSRDPFKENRRAGGVQPMEAEGHAFPLILRHADVKQVCRHWKTFSSDDPFMIVPHSETHVRTVRQLPIEVDLPAQGEYQALVEGLFRRPNEPGYRAEMQRLTDEIVAGCVGRGEVVLDRAVNPHLGFGFGVHHCLGAPQARLVLRCLMTALVEKVGRVEVLEAVPQLERESSFERQVGYERLVVRLLGRG